MKSQTSSRISAATRPAGRIAARSRSLFKMIMRFNSHPSIAMAGLRSSFKAPLLEEPVVMAHQQVRLHLAHGVEHHTNENQHARATKKRGHRVRDAHDAIKNNRDD